MPPRPIPGLACQPTEALGTVVRRRREAAGMTQEALEAASGVHVTHIRAIEASRRNPSVHVFWQLARGLAVPADVLAREVDAETAGMA